MRQYGVILDNLDNLANLTNLANVPESLRAGSSYAMPHVDHGSKGNDEAAAGPCSYAKKVNKRVKKQSNLREGLLSNALLGYLGWQR